MLNAMMVAMNQSYLGNFNTGWKSLLIKEKESLRKAQAVSAANMNGVVK